METKENMTSGSGVTVIGAETPSNYLVAPRSDGAPHSSPSMAGALVPSGVSVAGIMEKKKRGRPRKYGPDGGTTRTLSPMPLSSSAPPTVGGHPTVKRGRGRGVASAAKQQRLDMVSMSEAFGRADGANFTPHVITVNAGEDVTAKIISFCQQGPRAICILSANGMISNATLRQSDSSGGTLTYEGRFEIVNLCGSFTPSEREGTKYRAGGLSVSLSSPNGHVVGGCVAGLLIAASPIQIIVGSFLPSMPPEMKPKKPKVQQSVPIPFTITAAAPPQASSADKEACNGQGHNHHSTAPMQSIAPPPASYQRENWHETQHSMHERRTSSTDINISLPGGVQ